MVEELLALQANGSKDSDELAMLHRLIRVFTAGMTAKHNSFSWHSQMLVLQVNNEGPDRAVYLCLEIRRLSFR